MNVTALNEPIHILEVMEDVQPDLVLLDVNMPGLSDYDVCRVLKNEDSYKNTPVLFLTGNSDLQDRATAFQTGGNDFLNKPILQEELTARVKAHLDTARMQRQSVTLDDLTGLLKKDTFVRRLTDEFKKAVAQQENYALFINIDYFSEIENQGIFAGMEVTASLSRLLRFRFQAAALRSKWDGPCFALGIPGKYQKDVMDSLQTLSEEIDQIPFVNEMDKRYEVYVTTATAFYPFDDCSTHKGLIETARNRLHASLRQKTGVTFFS